MILYCLEGMSVVYKRHKDAKLAGELIRRDTDPNYVTKIVKIRARKGLVSWINDDFGVLSLPPNYMAILHYEEKIITF